MNYEFNLWHHVGVVTKGVCAAAAAAETSAHEGDDNTPGRGVGSNGPRGKNEKNRALGHFCAHTGRARYLSVTEFYEWIEKNIFVS